MAVNAKLLKSKIALNGDTQTELAKAIGITVSSLNCKLNAYKFVFKRAEIDKIAERYDLTEKEVQEIFFN